MISITHISAGAAVGTLVGSFIPNPVIAVPVAFLAGVASHHLLDMVPHTDTGSFRKEGDKETLKRQKKVMKTSELGVAVIDNGIALAILGYLFLAKDMNWALVAGAIGGVFPDYFHHIPIWGYQVREWWKGYYSFHETYHATAKGWMIPVGILTNLIITVISVWYVIAVNAKVH